MDRHPRVQVQANEGSVILLQSTMPIHQDNDYQKLRFKIKNLAVCSK